MHIELVTQRRALLTAYQRYLEVDRAWEIALQNLHKWFPDASPAGVFAIGNPGSPVRRLYVRRERALVQLEAVRLKLRTAKSRMTARQSENPTRQCIFISYVGPAPRDT